MRLRFDECIDRIAALSLAALVSLLALGGLPVLALDYGTCPQADVVEAELKHSNVSGYYIPGLRMIVLNRLILQRYGPAVGKFILAHECSHTDPEVGDNENAADCAAAKRGTQEGWLGNPDIVQVCVHLSRLIPDGLHPLPSYRCGNIRRCAALAAKDAGKILEAAGRAERFETPLNPDPDRAANARGRGTYRCTVMPNEPDC